MNRIKYNSLSIEQKRNICTYHEKNKGIKQKQLIIYFTKEFNLDQPIKSSTMSDIISNSTKYLNLEDGDTNKKRLRNPMLPEIEECLNIWLCSKVSLNIPISDVILREKAKDFCDLYRSDERYKKKLEDFKCSDGWLHKFKARYNIRKYNIHGESGDVDKNELENQRNDLKSFTINYKLEDIYNMDETGLFYR